MFEIILSGNSAVQPDPTAKHLCSKLPTPKKNFRQIPRIDTTAKRILNFEQNFGISAS
jgi:hypothetical protein